MENKIRLQKYMANCGLGSRRFCETLIKAGRVKINGSIVNELGIKINPESDKIVCNGEHLTPEKLITIMLNKPRKTICSSDDPLNRTRVIDLIDDLPERVYTVGRLDYLSEGLILVTNDGELAHSIMHPKYEIEKKYNVWINKELSNTEIKQSIKGIINKGDKLKFIDIKRINKSKDGFKYLITLKDGKNRHIRRIMTEIDKKIYRLQRISIGSIKLEGLKYGEYRRVKPSELKILRHHMLKK
tara:strand:+ start:156 stop:884 length:729 start_codon:yes stop_codon:yes gene_type:complete